MTLPVGSISGYLKLIGAAEFDAGIIGAQRSMNLAAGSASKMAGAVNESETAMSRNAVQAEKLRALYLSLTAAEERHTAAVQSGTASTAKLASTEAAEIRARLRLAEATDASTRSVAAMGGASATAAAEVSTFRTGLASTIETAGKLGLAFGAFEAIKQAIDIGKEATSYQRSMVQIRTLTGASQQEIDSMSKSMLGLAGKVAQSPEDLATSLYHVESVGLRGAKALDTVTAAAKGAGIGNADLEQTTNALTATIASGIIKNQSYSSAMSDLLTIVGSGDMTLEQFNESMSTGVLATLAGFGLSLRDVGAALALFGDNNIRGAKAATQLRMAVEAMAKPMASGLSELASLGLTSDSLAKDMQTGGLKAAIGDLSTRMHDAGYSAKQTGQVLVDAFGKRAGTGINVLVREFDTGVTNLLLKYSDLEHASMTFGQRWTAVTKTVSFHFQALDKEAEAAGITIAEKITPAVSKLADLTATAIPAALGIAKDALAPFVAAWDVVEAPIEATAHAADDVAHALGPVSPVLKDTAVAALAMWAAFQGYRIASAAVVAVRGMFGDLTLTAKADLGALGTAWRSTGAVSEGTAAQMAASFREIESEAAQATLAMREWAEEAATAQADAAEASETYSAAQVAAFRAQAVAAKEAADTARAAAAETSLAAETAAADIDAAGTAASVGWRSVLGPLGLAAIGVLAVATMFHKSSSASKEATDAAKAYTQALDSAGSTSLTDAIETQLKSNNVLGLINDLNKELGGTQYTGKQFVDAIADGGSALSDLRSRLEATVNAGTRFELIGVGQYATLQKFVSPAAEDAAKALSHLNTQYLKLTESAKKDLVNTAELAGASASIDKVAQSAAIASQTAQAYAQMMGIAIDKNGVASVSSATLTSAVNTVSKAYADATESGSSFLAELKTFSTSAGTAADRAALIGSTLTAANGDALSYAAQMNGAAAATAQLATDMASSAKAVGKHGESITTLAASIINLKTGTIDYSKSAATPLISDLQAMQTAAMNAAEAQYQHASATKGAKDAASEAYKVYESQTKGALVDEASQLGLTKSQAQKLADQYFGMPSKVKTLIEQEGADPIVTVLDKIGKLLANFTGQPWDIKVTANTDGAQASIRALKVALGELHSKKLTVTEYDNVVHEVTVNQGHAAGGTVTGSGGPMSDSVIARLSPGEEVIRASQAGKHRALLKAINAGTDGFASGGTISLGAASRIAPSGSSGLAGAVLFQAGDEIGRELIAGLDSRKGDFYASTAGLVASMTRAFGHARSVVLSSIAASVRPDKGSSDALTAVIAGATNSATGVIKSPAALAAQVGAPTAAAVAAATASQQHASIALANYKRLNAELVQVTKSTNAQVKAAEAASTAAKKHKTAVDDDTHSTTAERKAAAKQASDAEANAQTVSKAAKAQQSAIGALASKAKSSYQSIESAAKSQAATAQQDAQNVIAAITAQAQALEQQITGMESTISSGLTGGSDLSTIWGNLGDTLQTTSDNLTQAQQALADAQATVAQAAPDTAALAAAQAAAAVAAGQLASAERDVTAAQASGNTAQIVSAQNELTAAMTASTSAGTALAQAQSNAASASGPTADQLQAVTTAQTALTAAQTAYNQAQAADSANGVASVLSGFAGSEKQFSTDLTHLKSMIGTGPAAQALIQQLAGLGDTAGDALAQGLINDPQALDAILSSMQSIQQIATSEGDSLATSFYGAGVASMEQLIAGIESEYPALTSALAPIVAQLAASLGLTPPSGSSSGSGTGSSSSGSSSSASSSSSAAHAGAADIASYYLVHDTANGKWYDVNPSKQSVHELTGPQLAADQAAGATVNVRTSGVPHFASGVSDFAGGLAVVGELGPELLRLPAHASVIPTNQMKGVSAFGGADSAAVLQRLDRIEAHSAATSRKLDAIASLPVIGQAAVQGLRGVNSLHDTLTLAGVR